LDRIQTKGEEFMDMQIDEIRFRPKLQVINDLQIQQINVAILELLERTGVQITHPKALEILNDSGARVDGNRVRFPSWMVEDAIRKAPSRLVLAKQNGERTVCLEGDNSYFGPSLDCLDYMDPQTHVRERFTSEHIKVTAALCDALPSFDWGMTIGMAADVDANIADRVIARHTLTNCKKPLVFCCKDVQSVKDTYDMALMLCGGEENFNNAPCLVHYSEPISPLVYYDLAIEKLIYCAEKNIPTINSPCSQCSGTTPATFAGAMVQSAAESLSGLILAQLVREGAPFVFGAFTSVMDLKTTIFSYGAIELSMMTGALAQMAQFYKLPFFGTAGATDSKFCDAQAGAEAAMQCLSSGIIGSGLIHDCSSWMDHGSLVSPEFMVLVNDIVDNVQHYMKGIPISKETLALDLIDRVGPGGNYLQEKHTMAHFKEIKYSELFDRTILQKWEAAGKKTMEQRLQELTLKKMEIKPEPIPAEIEKEFDEMQKSWK
jgi:trimethylamine--corrinoid protein Co-methyltransferase